MNRRKFLKLVGVTTTIPAIPAVALDSDFVPVSATSEGHMSVLAKLEKKGIPVSVQSVLDAMYKDK